MEKNYKVIVINKPWSGQWEAAEIEAKLNSKETEGYEVVQATATKEAVIYLLKKVK